ncbi:hypothetical protein GGI35DRAFT_470094 [Trichoderma velutinum]
MSYGEQKTQKSNSLSFVTYENAKLSQDPKVRDTIRRHAMRDVANTRRQRQNYGNPNIGQYPIVNSELENQEERSNWPATEVVVNAMVRANQRQSLQPFPMSVSEATIRSSMPFLSLVESLVGLHVGIPCLSPEIGSYGEALLVSQPPADSRKLLSFIPSRYGQIPSVTHATDCLSARLQQIMQADGHSPSIGDVAIFNHHAMALKTLQSAIDDPNTRMLPETLCAAQLLYFFELLNGRPEIHPYKYHGAGVSILIQLRGPEGFKTDFEIALLMTYIGPFYNEALLDNTACLLMEERWLQTMHASITKYTFTSPDLAECLLDVWSHVVNLPALFRDTTDLVLSPQPPLPSRVQNTINHLVDDIAILDLRLGEIREQRFIHEDEETRKEEPTIDKKSSDSYSYSRQGNQPWPVLQANYVMCWLIQARLLSALSPFHFHKLEPKCQEWSNEMIRWKSDSSKLVQSGVCVANSIILTEETWTDGWTEDMNQWGKHNENRGMIEKWKYEPWCKVIGRRVINL